MFSKIKNLDPQTKLVVKAVTTIIVVNAVAIAAQVYVAKKDRQELDAAE